MKIEATNKLLQYCGRIDFSNPNEPLFIFPCSYVKLRFIGTKLSIFIKNYHAYWDNYIGVICDGRQEKICIFNQDEPLEDGMRQQIDIASNLEYGVHEVMIFKRQDACHEYRLCGLEIDTEELLSVEDNTNRRIEVYGDSVSAGEVSEAIEYVGKTDPQFHQGEFSNSYYSYAWILARELNAKIHDIAQGGIALQNGTGWFSVEKKNESYYMGMQEMYDKLQYNPSLMETSVWDFSKYSPQVVIIAIGQNDNHPVDYMKEDINSTKSQKWRDDYLKFVKKIREKYPLAQIILMTTILMHDENWDKSIEMVCNQLQDSRLHHFMFSNNGTGTPGHIRISEAEQMANELHTYITQLGDDIWKD